MNHDEINGTLQALQNQRNNALNEVAQAAGAVNVLHAKIKALEEEAKLLRMEIDALKQNQKPLDPNAHPETPLPTLDGPASTE